MQPATSIANEDRTTQHFSWPPMIKQSGILHGEDTPSPTINQPAFRGTSIYFPFLELISGNHTRSKRTSAVKPHQALTFLLQSSTPSHKDCSANRI